MRTRLSNFLGWLCGLLILSNCLHLFVLSFCQVVLAIPTWLFPISVHSLHVCFAWLFSKEGTSMDLLVTSVAGSDLDRCNWTLFPCLVRSWRPSRIIASKPPSPGHRGFSGHVTLGYCYTRIVCVLHQAVRQLGGFMEQR